MSDTRETLAAQIVGALHHRPLPKGAFSVVHLDANAAHAVAEIIAPLIEADRQAAKAEAWEEGKLRGKEVCAWAIGNQPDTERPDEENPYLAEQEAGA